MDKEKHHYHPECICDACMYEKVGAVSIGKHPADCHCPRCHNERVRNDTCTDEDYKAKKEATKPQHQTFLVCFESGHYKKLHGKWKGDTIWTHWIKPDGKTIHINKDKVEYYEEL